MYKNSVRTKKKVEKKRCCYHMVSDLQCYYEESPSSAQASEDVLISADKDVSTPFSNMEHKSRKDVLVLVFG